MASLDGGSNERVCAIKVDLQGGVSRNGAGYIIQFAGTSCILTCASVVDTPTAAKETFVYFNRKDGTPLRPVRLAPYRVWVSSPTPPVRDARSSPIQDLRPECLDFTIVAIHEEDELGVRHLASETLTDIGCHRIDLAGKPVWVGMPANPGYPVFHPSTGSATPPDLSLRIIDVGMTQPHGLAYSSSKFCNIDGPVGWRPGSPVFLNSVGAHVLGIHRGQGRVIGSGKGVLLASITRYVEHIASALCVKVARLEAEAQAVEADRQAADQLAAELNKKVQQLQELKEAHQVATWSSHHPSLGAMHGSLSVALREQSSLKDALMIEQSEKKQLRRMLDEFINTSDKWETAAATQRRQLAEQVTEQLPTTDLMERHGGNQCAQLRALLSAAEAGAQKLTTERHFLIDNTTRLEGTNHRLREQVCEKEKAMAELAEQRRQLEDEKAQLLAAASCRAADLSHPDPDLGGLSLGACAACPLDKSIKAIRDNIPTTEVSCITIKMLEGFQVAKVEWRAVTLDQALHAPLLKYQIRWRRSGSVAMGAGVGGAGVECVDWPATRPSEHLRSLVKADHVGVSVALRAVDMHGRAGRWGAEAELDISRLRKDFLPFRMPNISINHLPVR